MSRLDTAARYPPLDPGRAEELIGEVEEVSGEFMVDTKVYTDTKGDGSGELSKEMMEGSIKKSLGRLRRGSVSLFLMDWLRL
jgi:aflatoxin B1 aldehyde reductase